jgi:HAE1 family hydrophobic/amphiphilic exporter-1
MDFKELDLKKNFLGKIAEFFINRFQMVVLVILLVVSLGVTSLILLPKESLPEIVFPTVIVQTVYTGASPEDVENLVSVKIENVVKDVEDVENINSDSNFGFSVVTVEFKEGVDIDRKKIELDNELNNINFSDGIQKPQSNILKTSEFPLMNFSISGDYSIFRLTSIAETISDGLVGLNGVEEVNVLGGLNREMQVILDDTKLMEYSLNQQNVNNALRGLNIGVPVGEVNLNGTRYNIRVDEQINTKETLENVLVKNAQGNQAFIKDLGEVRDTSEPVESFSRTYDEEFNSSQMVSSVVLEVIRKNEADVIGTSENIKEYLETQKGRLYPDDIQISVSFDNAENVERDLTSIQDSAISGLIVVILVLFLFIGFREAIIVSLTIPLTLLLTLGILNTVGITLNTFAILGLIVALGLLVDNSIIVMENIDRLHKNGIKSKKAALVGTNQVGYPILASTLTTIAAFFPLAILPGILGAFVETIPRTIIIAIAASLTISIAITPALYVKIIKDKDTDLSKKIKQGKFNKIIKVLLIIVLSYYAFINDGDSLIVAIFAMVFFGGSMFIKEFWVSKKESDESILVGFYEKFISKIVKSKIRRGLVIILGIAFFFGSISLIATGVLKVAFFPTNEPNSAIIRVDTPGGTTLNETGDIIGEIENKLLEISDVKNFNTTIGGNEVDQGTINLSFVNEDRLEKDGYLALEKVQASVSDIPGAQIIVEGQTSGGPPVGKPLRIDVFGENLDESKRLASDYVDLLSDIPGVYNLETSVKDGVPQVYVDILEKKAQNMGLSAQDIAGQLRNRITGITSTTFKINGEEIDVVIKSGEENYEDFYLLNSIYIGLPTGDQIPLSMVAELKEQSGFSSIKRQGQERLLFIEGDLREGTNINDVIDNFNSKRENIIIPEGLRVSFGGDVAGIQENFLSLFQSMILAVFLVFIILTIQFDSILQPFVILLTVPMAVIGVILGLLITGNEFGFYAFMGIVALVGIAVNDAIVLIDYMNFLRESGEKLSDAIVNAAKTRFNPVLATSLTTIGGVLPLAFREVYYEQFSYALIFGLLITTILTLVFIPVIYSILEGIKLKKIKKDVV